MEALKSSSKNVVHKATGATSEFIENKIGDKIVKSLPAIDKNQEILKK